jgi:lantibiotic biosynthesis protein
MRTGWRERGGVDPIAHALGVRSQRVHESVIALRRLAGCNELPIPVERIAESLAHMHLNRLLAEPSATAELTVYHHLERILASELARLAHRCTRSRPQPSTGA